MLVWTLATALALDVVVGEPTGPRRYKLEAYGYNPVPGNRYNLDWAETELEFWSALLSCERVAPRLDRCTFEGDQIEFGYRIKGAPDLRVFAVKAPTTLEIAWSKDGVPRFDLQGDLDAFHESAANTLIPLLRGAEGKTFTADSWRRIGAEMQGSLVFWLLGALELPMPKKNPVETSYKAKAPVLAQSWLAGAYGGSVDLAVTGQDGPVVLLGGTGRFGEVNPRDTSESLKGELELHGAYDTTRQLAVATRTHVHFERHYTGYYGDRVSFMNVALPEHTRHAGELEGAPIGPIRLTLPDNPLSGDLTNRQLP